MFNKAGLEELLVKNWTSVLDGRALLAFVLKATSHTTFSIDSKTVLQEQKSASVSVSRFEATGDGRYLVWAEFSVPRGSDTDVGTVEIMVGQGEPQLIQVVGRRVVTDSRHAP